MLMSVDEGRRGGGGPAPDTTAPCQSIKWNRFSYAPFYSMPQLSASSASIICAVCPNLLSPLSSMDSFHHPLMAPDNTVECAEEDSEFSQPKRYLHNHLARVPGNSDLRDCGGFVAMTEANTKNTVGHKYYLQELTELICPIVVRQ